MNLTYLEYFDAAARYGSFSRAAKELFVTPQTVSTAIAALEREWGFALFDRRASGIELTEAGSALLKQTSVVLSDVANLENLARRKRTEETETLTFAYASASLPQEGYPFSLADLACFRQEHPDIALNVFELTSDACVDAVVGHRAELAYAAVAEVPADVESICLSRGSFLVGISRENPLSQRDALSFADLENVPIFAPPDLNLTYSRIIKRCRAYGFEPRFSVTPFSVENAREFVRDNCGVSFTPRFFAEDAQFSEGLNAVFLPLIAKDDFSLPLRLVWRKGIATDACVKLRTFILQRFGMNPPGQT